MQYLDANMKMMRRGREGVILVQGAAPVSTGVMRPVLCRNVADKLEGVQRGP